MKPIVKGLRGAVVAVAVAALVQSVGAMALGPLADASSSTLTATTAVNVRAGATTNSAKVGILYRGEKVQAIGSSNGWTTVTYRGRTAYVSSAYLSGSGAAATPPQSSAPSGSAFTTAYLNLRTGPSLSSSVSVVASKGAKLSLTGSISGSYTQVTWGSSKLWAATSYLSSAASAPTQSLPAVTGRVSATAALMIRTSSSRSFTSLGDVPRGTILDVTGVVENGVAQVLWKGQVRWVNNGYIKPISGTTNSPSAPTPPTTTTRYATANLNIWNASTGGSNIGEIPRGSAVAVTGKVSSGRAEVLYNGAVKWVTARYLAASAPGGASGGSSSSSGSLNRGYSSGLDNANYNTKSVVRHIWDTQPAIKTMYGWRRGADDHSAGRAVDVMLPNYRANNALGWQIANYYRANAKKFGIDYIIFDQQIWSVGRDSQGWRRMAGRGSDTANHIDHVHINTRS